MVLSGELVLLSQTHSSHYIYWLLEPTSKARHFPHFVHVLASIMSGLSDRTTQRQTTRPRNVTVALFLVHVHHSVVEQQQYNQSAMFYFGGVITKLSDKHIIYHVYEKITVILFIFPLVHASYANVCRCFRLMCVYLISSFLLLIYSML